MYEHVMHYAKTGQSKEFASLEEANSFAKFASENILTGGGDSIREKITVDLVHGTHIDEKHGWDGKRGHTWIEVKNETLGLYGKSFSGKGVFNNLTWKSFKKYETQEGIYISAGYSRSGVLLHAFAFDMKELVPLLRSKLQEKLPYGDEKGKNVTISVSVKDYPEKCEVVYLPNNFEINLYSKLLRKVLINNQADGTKINARYLSSKPNIRKSKKVEKSSRRKGKKSKISLNEKIKAIYGVDSTFELDEIEKRVAIWNPHFDTKWVKLSSVNSSYSRKMKKAS